MMYQLFPSSSAATGSAEMGGSTGGSSAGGNPEKSSSAGSAGTSVGYWNGSRSDMRRLYLEKVSNNLLINRATSESTRAKYAAKPNTATMTTVVVARTCFQVGHVTRRISCCSSSK